jgi:triosephosphate isomerase (TIM)
MTKTIIVANWKMNPLTSKEAEKLFLDVAKGVSGMKKSEIVVCPPHIYLEKLSDTRKTKKIILGAQDAFYGEVGAFTGEVSGDMLHDIGARYVILGHSERRARGENSEEINKKIKDALSAGLHPILCVGETDRDQNHEYFGVVKAEVEKCMTGIPKSSLSKVVIAYEPVWAISTTKDHKDASADDSRGMAIFIRKILSDKFGKESAGVRILYGGSVNERNAEGFLKDGGVDGLLVGRASLSAKKFTEIVKVAENIS